MRALKILVISMGVLIVAAVATIAVTLVDRSGDGARRAAWAVALTAPAGAAIRDYQLSGDRLVIRLSRPGQPDELRIVDLASGRQIGGVTIKNAP